MEMEEQMYDVVAVDTHTSNVIWVVGPKTAANAEAIHNMAIMRQGVEDQLFVFTAPGAYKEGDIFTGTSLRL